MDMFDWRRFWCPRDGILRLEDQGFLANPEAESAWIGSSDAVAFDSVVKQRCVILLGEPGIGKSTALRAEVANVRAQAKADDLVVSVNLNTYGDETRLIGDLFRNEQIVEWQRSERQLHLFVDSVDECQLRIHQVTSILADELEKLAQRIQRLNLRIACRTAEWSTQFEDQLKKLWGEEVVGVYELAPLRKVDVTVAASSLKLNAEQFLDEVFRVGAEPLAAKPVTLRFLLQLFQRDGQLPATQRELYREGCAILCREESRERRLSDRFQLTPEIRLAVAQRIAGALIFGGKSSVFCSGDAGIRVGDDVAISELSGGTELVNGNEVAVDSNAVIDVLRTGLFSSRGRDRLGFSHQTYAEFLAAAWVHDKALPQETVISLISNDSAGGRRVIPQLAETAAWLASLDQKVFDNLADFDPQVLLKSDVAKADNLGKAVLVDSLLRKHDAEVIANTEWHVRRNYRRLRHPQLADQLRPYITEFGRSASAREHALDIAAACSLSELQNEIADVVINPNENGQVRWLAALSLRSIADKSTKLRLKPLLVNTDGVAVSDELKAELLNLLWPDVLSPNELFSVLSEPGSDTDSSAYRSFLRSFPKSLQASSLPAALDWMSRSALTTHSQFDFEELIGTVFRLTEQWHNEPDVFAALVSLVIARLGDWTWRVEELSQLLQRHSDLRHRVLTAVVPSLEEFDVKQARNFSGGAAQCLYSEDFDWLVDQVLSEPNKQVAHRWTLLVDQVWRCDRHCCETIARLAASNEAFAEVFAERLQPIALDSEIAAKKRAAYQRDLELEEESRQWRRRPALDPPVKERIERCLVRFEAGVVSEFWWLCRQLTLKEDSTHFGDEFNPDLTTLPGWEIADAATQKRIIDAAETWLYRGEPKPEEWLGQIGVMHYPALAGYRALRLIQSQRPAVFESLPIAVWNKWACIIAAWPLSPPTSQETAIHQENVKHAWRIAPDETARGLLGAIDATPRSFNFLCCLQSLENGWDSKLCEILVRKGVQNSLRPEWSGQILEEALKAGSEEAFRVATQWLQPPIPCDSFQRARALYAAVALMKSAPITGWPIFWEAINIDEAFGKAVLLEFSTGFIRIREASPILQLPEQRLGKLFERLSRMFPYGDDANSDVFLGGRDCVQRFRDECVSVLRARGTSESVTEIRRLIAALPELDWLKWTLLDAENNLRRQSWNALQVSDLLKLAARPNSPLVRDANDLLDVVVSSLRDLEAKLQGETPATPAIWDEVKKGVFRPKDEENLSNFVKLHLESDLQRRGIIALREVEIRRGEGKSKGERTDIHITGIVAGSHSQSMNSVRVIVEAKGCWHDELKTAMQSQLLSRYMQDNPCRHGIYLVGWFNCDHWDADDSRKSKTPKWTIEKAQEFFDDQVTSITEAAIQAVVINCALR